MGNPPEVPHFRSLTLISDVTPPPGPRLPGALPLLYPKQGIKVPSLTSPSHQEKADIHRKPRKTKMKAQGGNKTRNRKTRSRGGGGGTGWGLLTKPSLFLRNTKTSPFPAFQPPTVELPAPSQRKVCSPHKNVSGGRGSVRMIGRVSGF